MRTLSVCLLSVLAACQQENGVRRLLEPPEIALVTPEPEQVFRQGSGPLAFSGTATDSYDPAAELQAFWRIDELDEIELGVDRDDTARFSFDADALALGAHEVTLRVVDSDGDESTVSAPWILDGALLGPTVEITAPSEGATFPIDTELSFRGTATDNNTAPEDLVFSWTTVDGELPGSISANGNSVVFATLPVGVHLVTLTVTDKDGEIGEDTVTVEVLPEEDPPPDPEPEPIVEAQVGDLVFSELNVNPILVADELGEWVELYNTSSTPIQIQGYAFHDLDYDSYTIVGSAIVPGTDYVVLCASTDPVLNGGVSCDVGFARGTGGAGFMALGNDGDEVVLSRPDGVAIDEVVYDGTWFTPGAATGLDPARLDADNNDDESMWCDQVTPFGTSDELGTPGAENDPC
jgi:hypothetical protein